MLRDAEMPRNYTKGLKQRPGGKAGEACEAEGCTATEASSWANGLCAACRKKSKKAPPPLADVTNAKRRRVEEQKPCDAVEEDAELEELLNGIFPDDVDSGDAPESGDEQEAEEVDGPPRADDGDDEPMPASACEQELRAKLEAVSAELARERELSSLFLRSAVSSFFEREGDEPTIAQLHKAVNGKTKEGNYEWTARELRWRLAAAGVLDNPKMLQPDATMGECSAAGLSFFHMEEYEGYRPAKSWPLYSWQDEKAEPEEDEHGKPSEQGLPDGWKVNRSRSTGRYYYYHADDKESTYERPSASV